MIEKTNNILQKIAAETSEIVLFHSVAGKDSIALLELCAPFFKRIVCCFMYTVPDLGHMKRHIQWAKATYPNCEFIETPHFALYQFIKIGFLGTKQDKTVINITLAQIVERIKLNTGIPWVIVGFKQSDSMNRRLMLRTYELNAINRKTNMCYPLSEWTNKEVLKFIQMRKLIKPIVYGQGQSQGQNPDDIDFLKWCRENYPSDLTKIFNVFPLAKIKLDEYDRIN